MHFEINIVSKSKPTGHGREMKFAGENQFKFSYLTLAEYNSLEKKLIIVYIAATSLSYQTL